MAKDKTDKTESARNSYHLKEALLDLRFVLSLSPEEVASLKAELARIEGGSSGDAGTSA